jgi:hypothetical protein
MMTGITYITLLAQEIRRKSSPESGFGQAEIKRCQEFRDKYQIQAGF